MTYFFFFFVAFVFFFSSVPRLDNYYKFVSNYRYAYIISYLY